MHAMMHVMILQLCKRVQSNLVTTVLLVRQENEHNRELNRILICRSVQGMGALGPPQDAFWLEFVQVLQIILVFHSVRAKSCPLALSFPTATGPLLYPEPMSAQQGGYIKYFDNGNIPENLTLQALLSKSIVKCSVCVGGGGVWGSNPTQTC
jgi:hypothetical protein